MKDIVDLRNDPVSKLHVASDGGVFAVNIYPDPKSFDGWILEAVSSRGLTMIWLKEFSSQQKAYEEFLRSMENGSHLLAGAIDEFGRRLQ